MDSIDLYQYLAQISGMIEDGQIVEAVTHGQFILTQHPRHVETYKTLGRAYLKAGVYEQATDIYRRILSADPSDFDSHYALALAFQDVEAYPQALWHIEHAYEIDTSNQSAVDLRESLYADASLDPPEIKGMPLASVARLYVRGGIFDQAIEELTRLIASKPERIDWKILLTEALWGSGKTFEARKLAESILEILPNSVVIRAVLGDILLQHQNVEVAEKHLDILQSLVLIDQSHIKDFDLVSQILSQTNRIPEKYWVQPLQSDGSSSFDTFSWQMPELNPVESNPASENFDWILDNSTDEEYVSLSSATFEYEDDQVTDRIPVVDVGMLDGDPAEDDEDEPEIFDGYPSDDEFEDDLFGKVVDDYEPSGIDVNVFDDQFPPSNTPALDDSDSTFELDFNDLDAAKEELANEFSGGVTGDLSAGPYQEEFALSDDDQSSDQSGSTPDSSWLDLLDFNDTADEDEEPAEAELGIETFDNTPSEDIFSTWYSQAEEASTGYTAPQIEDETPGDGLDLGIADLEREFQELELAFDNEDRDESERPPFDIDVNQELEAPPLEDIFETLSGNMPAVDPSMLGSDDSDSEKFLDEFTSLESGSENDGFQNFEPATSDGSGFTGWLDDIDNTSQRIEINRDEPLEDDLSLQDTPTVPSEPVGFTDWLTDVESSSPELETFAGFAGDDNEEEPVGEISDLLNEVFEFPPSDDDDVLPIESFLEEQESLSEAVGEFEIDSSDTPTEPSQSTEMSDWLAELDAPSDAAQPGGLEWNGPDEAETAALLFEEDDTSLSEETFSEPSEEFVADLNVGNDGESALTEGLTNWLKELETENSPKDPAEDHPISLPLPDRRVVDEDELSQWLSDFQSTDTLESASSPEADESVEFESLGEEQAGDQALFATDDLSLDSNDLDFSKVFEGLDDGTQLGLENDAEISFDLDVDDNGLADAGFDDSGQTNEDHGPDDLVFNLQDLIDEEPKTTEIVDDLVDEPAAIEPISFEAEEEQEDDQVGEISELLEGIDPFEPAAVASENTSDLDLDAELDFDFFGTTLQQDAEPSSDLNFDDFAEPRSEPEIESALPENDLENDLFGLEIGSPESTAEEPDWLESIAGIELELENDGEMAPTEAVEPEAFFAPTNDQSDLSEDEQPDVDPLDALDLLFAERDALAEEPSADEVENAEAAPDFLADDQPEVDDPLDAEPVVEMEQIEDEAYISTDPSEKEQSFTDFLDALDGSEPEISDLEDDQFDSLSNDILTPESSGDDILGTGGLSWLSLLGQEDEPSPIEDDVEALLDAPTDIFQDEPEPDSVVSIVPEIEERAVDEPAPAEESIFPDWLEEDVEEADAELSFDSVEDDTPEHLDLQDSDPVDPQRYETRPLDSDLLDSVPVEEGEILNNAFEDMLAENGDVDEVSQDSLENAKTASLPEWLIESTESTNLGVDPLVEITSGLLNTEALETSDSPNEEEEETIQQADDLAEVIEPDLLLDSDLATLELSEASDELFLEEAGLDALGDLLSLGDDSEPKSQIPAVVDDELADVLDSIEEEVVEPLSADTVEEISDNMIHEDESSSEFDPNQITKSILGSQSETEDMNATPNPRLTPPEGDDLQETLNWLEELALYDTEGSIKIPDATFEAAEEGETSAKEDGEVEAEPISVDALATEESGEEETLSWLDDITPDVSDLENPPTARWNKSELASGEPSEIESIVEESIVEESPVTQLHGETIDPLDSLDSIEIEADVLEDEVFAAPVVDEADLSAEALFEETSDLFGLTEDDPSLSGLFDDGVEKQEEDSDSLLAWINAEGEEEPAADLEPDDLEDSIAPELIESQEPAPEPKEVKKTASLFGDDEEFHVSEEEIAHAAQHGEQITGFDIPDDPDSLMAWLNIDIGGADEPASEDLSFILQDDLVEESVVENELEISEESTEEPGLITQMGELPDDPDEALRIIEKMAGESDEFEIDDVLTEDPLFNIDGSDQIEDIANIIEADANILEPEADVNEADSGISFTEPPSEVLFGDLNDEASSGLDWLDDMTFDSDPALLGEIDTPARGRTEVEEPVDQSNQSDQVEGLNDDMLGELDITISNPDPDPVPSVEDSDLEAMLDLMSDDEPEAVEHKGNGTGPLDLADFPDLEVDLDPEMIEEEAPSLEDVGNPILGSAESSIEDWLMEETESSGSLDWLDDSDSGTEMNWLIQEEQASQTNMLPKLEDVVPEPPPVRQEPVEAMQSQVDSEMKITSDLSAESGELPSQIKPRPTVAGKGVTAELNAYRVQIESGQDLRELISTLKAQLGQKNDPRLYQMLGDAYMKDGQLQAALEAYRKAQRML